MKKIVLPIVAAVCAAVSFAAEFKAGFARVDITPPMGSFMPGYFKDRRATMRIVCHAWGSFASGGSGVSG